MATKTISLSEDAYERLKAEKREGESFSDVVRRLTNRVNLANFHGSLSPDTADALEDTITAQRATHAANRETRRARLTEHLDDS